MNAYTHRLVLPYKDIFTTVYIIKTQAGVVLFDAASYEPDFDTYILPALQELKIDLQMVRFVFISHHHKDHSGGLENVLKACPHAMVVSRSPILQEMYRDYNFYMPEDGDVIADVLRVVTIPGHTIDSSALLDERAKTLITGDSLQLYGIFGSEDWGSNINFPAEHLAAVEKVRTLHFETIMTAHDYHPYGHLMCGRERVEATLDACTAPLLQIKKTICEHPELDDEEARQIYNNSDEIPPVKQTVFAAMRAAIEAGRV